VSAADFIAGSQIPLTTTESNLVKVNKISLNIKIHYWRWVYIHCA